MAVCGNIARFFLALTGICYFISSGILCFIGVWSVKTYSPYHAFADASLTIFPAIIVIVASIIMFVIGMISCIAAYKTQRMALTLLFILVLICFLAEVSAGSLGYIYRSKIESVLDDDMVRALDDYNVTSIHKGVDHLQSELHCCGVHNATDWLSSTYWKIGHNDTVPTSCCRTNLNVTCSGQLDPEIIYTEGCLDKLEDEFKNNLIYISISVICIASIQLLALLSSCILVCRTRDQAGYRTLGEPIGGGLRV